MTGAAQETFNYHKDFQLVLAKTKDPADSLYYNKLLPRYYANDTSLTNYEVLSLLIAYTDKPAYKPYEDLEREKEIYRMNAMKDYNEALSAADTFLMTHPFSVKVIFAKAYAYNKLEKQDSASFYAYRGFSIFHAMELTGDGRSAETPFFALGPEDGQDYIRKAVRVNVGRRAIGQDSNGNFLNVLEAKAENGNCIILYFNIHHSTIKLQDEEKVAGMEKKDKKSEKQ